MTVESANDRHTMLADFGVSVIFSPGETFPHRNNDTVTITGIFDADYVEIEAAEIGASSKAPALICRTADVVGAEIRSMAEIGVNRYKVVSVQPEGDGEITLLVLEGPQ